MRISDWSSDVCSSDLFGGRLLRRLPVVHEHEPGGVEVRAQEMPHGEPGHVDASRVLRLPFRIHRQADQPLGLRTDAHQGCAAFVAEIGRSSFWERVYTFMSISDVAVQLKITINKMNKK